MLNRTEPLITVPPQAILDAAIRNAREERAAVLNQLTGTLARSVSGLWKRMAHTGGTGATAGCS